LDRFAVASFLVLCASSSCSSESSPPPLQEAPGDASALDGGVDSVAPPADTGGTSDGASDATADGAAGSFVATSIAKGQLHTCALTAQGGVRCWGDNRNGQLGDGTTMQRNAPVAVKGLSSGVTAIAAGDFHTCALSAGGVQCWGHNISGALGDGTTTDRQTPMAVSGLPSSVVAIAAGGGDTCALLGTGDSYCWGLNNFGQLGVGTTGPTQATPKITQLVPGGVLASLGAAALAPGGDHTCLVATMPSGSVVCSGDNSNGALGNTLATSTLVYIAGGAGADTVAVAANVAFTCAIIPSGAVASDASDLSDASDASVSGGGTVECWGGGNVGSGAAALAVPGLTNAVALAAGTDHVCAATADGSVVCWGNLTSVLPDGGKQKTPVAIQRLPTGVTAVAAGNEGDCALAAGAVLCWGTNTFGDIGDGTTMTRDTPVPVVGFP
jgi:alpha-tubulin suppressor-like RCC1 family protein